MSYAQVLLPMGTFAETSGSYVSAEGRWQEFRGCAQPVGQSRPGWKILRVLANQLGLEGFSYESSADVLAEFRGTCRERNLRRPVRNRARLQGRAPRQCGGTSHVRRGRHRPPRRVLAADARRAERRRREGLSHAGIHRRHGGQSLVPELQSAIIVTLQIVGVMISIVIAVAMLTLAERKVIGYMQLRRGPNRVSFFGLAGAARTRAAIRGRDQACCSRRSSSRASPRGSCSCSRP